MIRSIITALEKATSLPVKPLDTDTIEDCIVYRIYPNKDDGATSQQKIELRLITETLAEAAVYRKQIIKALVPTGDNQTITGIYKCILNGGGQLKEYSTNTIHTLMYFDILTRSEN